MINLIHSISSAKTGRPFCRSRPAPSVKKAPDTRQGRKNFHGTTLICPGDISSHPITGMNRPAPCGTLQSGCPTALAEGSHHLPLAESRFRKAGFFTAFHILTLYPFSGICQEASASFLRFSAAFFAFWRFLIKTHSPVRMHSPQPIQGVLSFFPLYKIPQITPGTARTAIKNSHPYHAIGRSPSQSYVNQPHCEPEKSPSGLQMRRIAGIKPLLYRHFTTGGEGLPVA